jgi:hypothetical protein
MAFADVHEMYKRDAPHTRSANRHRANTFLMKSDIQPSKVDPRSRGAYDPVPWNLDPHQKAAVS